MMKQPSLFQGLDQPSLLDPAVDGEAKRRPHPEVSMAAAILRRHRDGKVPPGTLDRMAHQLARRADPATSRAAAASQVSDLTEKQRQVLRVLASLSVAITDEGLTARCADAYGWPTTSSSARTRRAELQAGGLVEEAGEVVLSTGRKGRLWRISPKGRAWLGRADAS